jgi:hypothetical protein
MSKTPPWRVAAIAIDVTLPAGTPDSRVAAVRRAVAHCTVHNSLLDPPVLTIATATAVPDAASVRLAAGAHA